jgi:hypothetical protein
MGRPSVTETLTNSAKSRGDKVKSSSAAATLSSAYLTVKLFLFSPIL